MLVFGGYIIIRGEVSYYLVLQTCRFFIPLFGIYFICVFQGGYMAAKRMKLNDQFDNELGYTNNFFKGVAIYVDGYTSKLQVKANNKNNYF